MEIQLTIQQLEVIVKNARLLKTDESLSDTIVIKTLDNYKGHLGGHMIDVFLRNKEESEGEVQIY